MNTEQERTKLANSHRRPRHTKTYGMILGDTRHMSSKSQGRANIVYALVAIGILAYLVASGSWDKPIETRATMQSYSESGQ